MIKLENISKVYRTKEIETLALDNINFDVKEGEFVSVMGPSGCGKSTLLNIIGLLDEPDNGKIALDKQDILTY
jgi:putative ABC transport system ATP-binding protein